MCPIVVTTHRLFIHLKLHQNLLKRPAEANVRIESVLFKPVLVTKVKGGRHTGAEHEAFVTLIAITNVAKHEIAEAGA